MEVVRLTAGDCRLLSTRFAEHGNSYRAMAGALADAGRSGPLARLRALRRVERRFEVDLGSLCHRFHRRNHEDTHPIERAVMSYIATWRRRPDGCRELWVLLDRLRNVRTLIEEGRRVGERES